MGQVPSSENLPKTLREDVCRREITGLTYEEFRQYLGQLNALSKRCLDPNAKQLVFDVEEGTDSSLLWKSTVRIECIKVDCSIKRVEARRFLSLSEFLKIFQTLQGQLLPAHQSSTSVRMSNIRKQFHLGVESTFSGNKREKNLLTTTMLLEEVDNATYKAGERLNECCICFERKLDVMLPCAHSYCQLCFEQWYWTNKTCPICREELDSAEDTWVISEFPDPQEISEAIRHSLLNLA